MNDDLKPRAEPVDWGTRRPEAPLCLSRLKQQREDGRTECWNRAGFKTDHVGFGRCYMHGGRTQNGKQFAQRQQASEILDTYGIANPIPTDPAAGLLLEIARTAGHIAWLGQKIGEMDPDSLIYGEKSFAVKTGFESGDTTTVGPGLHVWLELYHRERAMFVRVCAEAARAKIAERQVKLAEEEGERAGQFLAAVLDDLALSEEQTARVPALIERHLRLA